ncbi:MAG: ferredoxin [Planctomycetaceae bacterium]|nr:ferredoxin [Planctomycetaceae bacterium]
MKAIVDETCIGCELCVDICPEVFQMGEDGFAKPIVDPVPSELRAKTTEAAESCPVDAIHIEE